jgi:UDP-N-acetylglucosamine diphosphorylase / glucose-1-phosphate thymidylyltransferase / UDP-N-acetylgalactosamine diphosphorylase / glucosamine-1-phosphate N-acetyltransferase / galactosamine-1-phosphate N-acetyltransferase
MQAVAKDRLMGVVLAAGRGVRAYPTTKKMPKVLIRVNGKTLLERNIGILRDELGAREVIVVIGYLGNMVREYLSSRDLGVRFTFVEQTKQNGIGSALLAVEKSVAGRRFAVILGDELYVGSNHSQLLGFLDRDCDAVLTFRRERNKSKISRNFTGDIEEGRVMSLTEKPKSPETNLMGLGTYLLSDKVFNYIRKTPPSSLRGEVEITDALSNMAKEENVFACILDGEYVNVTSTDDINSANYLWRQKHSGSYKVSVVIPAYNEQETIAHVVNEFQSHDAVNEVLVVDNNSKDNTSEVAEKAGARVVLEKEQGYGCALCRGMDEAWGDIMILTEADGSFRSKDIPKFLEYLRDCDMVIGTRTTCEMIEQGANMYPLLRWGNVFFGKFIEALWWSRQPRFTDVGCTYRAIWRTSYQRIRPLLRAKGAEFSPEMMIAILLCRQRIIEVPVSYYRRIGGESKHSKTFFGASKTALKMLRLILKYRMGRYAFADRSNIE